MSRSQTPDLSGLKILVVEDEYFLADEICSALKQAGAAIVGPAPTLGKGLTLARETAGLDFAILDINLHGESAIEIARTLRERSIGFLFATGYDTEVLPEEFHDVPHFSKPSDGLALMQQLGSVITRKREAGWRQHPDGAQ
jgi:DNA-binding response OmpR family regulator